MNQRVKKYPGRGTAPSSDSLPSGEGEPSEPHLSACQRGPSSFSDHFKHWLYALTAPNQQHQNTDRSNKYKLGLFSLQNKQKQRFLDHSIFTTNHCIIIVETQAFQIFIDHFI